MANEIKRDFSHLKTEAERRKHHKNHRLIKDEANHKHFIEQGFVVIKNVISENAIRFLKSFYDNKFSTPSGMYVTHHFVESLERNKSNSDIIFNNLEESFQKIFTNYRKVIAHFAAKGKGKEGLFNFHQDWSIIDEFEFGIIHCWVPLQSVNSKNGTLAVLPRTHLLFNNYRSGTCPIRFTPLTEYKDEPVYVEANRGDLVLYHPALFHGSGSNESDEVRIAVVAAISNQNSENLYYNHEGDGRYLKYSLTDVDLFSRLNELSQGKNPLGSQVGEVLEKAIDLTDEELIDTIKLEYLRHK